MKTLDEVIEKCQGYVDDVVREWDKQGCPRPFDDMVDALCYLKEYRTEKKILRDRKEHYEYWENKYYAELEKNEPLDWETLKQMEGKPVWVECNRGGHIDNGWRVILHVNRPECGCEDAMYCISAPCKKCTFQHKNLGKTWQAYRKERE